LFKHKKVLLNMKMITASIAVIMLTSFTCGQQIPESGDVTQDLKDGRA